MFAALAYQTYVRKEISSPPHEHQLRTLRQQVGWISRSRVCATLIGSFAIATAAIGLFNATLPAFMAHHPHQQAGYGLALGFIGIGFTLGEGATAFIHRESVARRSIALAFIGNGAALWLLAHATTLPTEFLALAMLGTFDGTTEVVFDTLSQRATPQRLQASVFALAGAFQNVAMTAGLLAAPLVVTYTQPSTAVTIGGAGCAIAAIAAAIGLHSKNAQISAHDSLHDTLGAAPLKIPINNPDPAALFAVAPRPS